MKKIISIPIKITFIMVFWSMFCFAAEHNNVYKSHEFGQSSYSIEYSDEWDLRELSPDSAGFLYKGDPEVIVSISIQNLRKPGYKFDGMEKFMAGYDNSIKNMVINYNIEKREKTSFAGQNAYYSIYTYSDKIDPERKLKAYMYSFVLDGEYAFDIGYTASYEIYNKYLPEAQKLIMSFKLLMNTS